MNDFAASTPSGPTPIAPKTFGQILDRTFRLMRANFKTLVGIAAIPSILMMLTIAVLELIIWFPMIRQFPQQPTPETMLRNFTPSFIIPVIVVVSLLCLAIFSMYLAAASYASVQADSGVKVSLREAYGLAWRRGGRHLWLLVLCYLYAFLPLLLMEGFVLLVVSIFAHGGAKGNAAVYLLIPLAVLFYIVALVYGILMGLRLSLAYSICTAENLPAHAAIKRSFELTRGAKGRIFLVILVIYAALYAAMLALELVAFLLGAVGVVVMMVLHAHVTAPWSYIGLGAIGIIVFAFLVLFISLTYATLIAALAVLYHDQRLRKDGALTAPAQNTEIA
jgi:hypothetical protein